MLRSRVVMSMYRIEAYEAKPPAKGLFPGYRKMLEESQSFDQPSIVYYERYNDGLQRLGKGERVEPSELPPEGIPYFYDERILAMAKSYLGLARHHLAAKDYAMAERNALNAVTLVDSRTPSNHVIAAVKRDAWALLERTFAESGGSGAALVAEGNRRLIEDYLASQDGQAATQAFYDSEAQGKLDAEKTNGVIIGINAVAQERSNAMVMAGLGAASAGLATYQQQQVQSQIDKQGYATSDQSLQLINARMNRFIGTVVLAANLDKAGAWGNRFAMLYSLGPTAMTQFTNPSAGIDPVAIVEDVSKRANKLGKGHLLVKQSASRVSGLAGEMRQARSSGDPKQAEQAFGKFYPAYMQLVQALKKVRE